MEGEDEEIRKANEHAVIRIRKMCLTHKCINNTSCRILIAADKLIPWKDDTVHPTSDDGWAELYGVVRTREREIMDVDDEDDMIIETA